VFAALGYEAVTTATAFEVLLPVMFAPPPIIVPVEQLAVAVTVDH
jgi:hypothetical protein